MNTFDVYNGSTDTATMLPKQRCSSQIQLKFALAPVSYCDVTLGQKQTIATPEFTTSSAAINYLVSILNLLSTSPALSTMDGTTHTYRSCLNRSQP